MNDADRKLVLDALENSRDHMLGALRTYRDQTPGSGWSVLQIAEHVAICEEAIFGLVRERIAVMPPNPGLRRKLQWTDQSLVDRISITTEKAISPEQMLPTGRFKSVDEAAAAFAQSRALTVEYAATTDDDLRARVLPHPALGPLDGVQWLLFQASHSLRHAHQVASK